MTKNKKEKKKSTATHTHSINNIFMVHIYHIQIVLFCKCHIIWSHCFWLSQLYIYIYIAKEIIIINKQKNIVPK